MFGWACLSCSQRQWALPFCVTQSLSVTSRTRMACVVKVSNASWASFCHAVCISDVTNNDGMCCKVSNTQRANRFCSSLVKSKANVAAHPHPPPPTTSTWKRNKWSYWQNNYTQPADDAFSTFCDQLVLMMMMSWCLMSSDVIWHIRDKLWPMPKHGSIKATYVRCMRV